VRRVDFILLVLILDVLFERFFLDEEDFFFFSDGLSKSVILAMLGC